MEKIYNLRQAEDWFINHSSGSVIAVNAQGEEKECFTFADAISFLKDS